MTFLELLGLAGTMVTVMGVFLTYYGLTNNRTIKEESRATREILLRMEQGQAEARKEASEARKEAREAFLRIEQGQLRVEEMQAQARTEMAEAIRYLADLIRVESGRRG